MTAFSYTLNFFPPGDRRHGRSLLSPFFMVSSDNETNTNDLIPLVHRHLVVQLRSLVNEEMAQSEKIETAQVLLYQASKHLKSPIKLLVPRSGFSKKVLTAFGIAKFLSAQTLVELTIEILEEPTDTNG